MTLAPDAGSYDPPTITDAKVLTETGRAGGYPAPTTLYAEFRATGIGVSTITTATDFACLHATPRCLSPPP